MPQPAESPPHRTPLANAMAGAALLGFGQPSATGQLAVLAPPPVELDYLRRVIGAEASFRLVETNGGCRIYIPKHPLQGSTLAREIGLHAARHLAAEFGGERLKVPIARVWRVATYSLNGFSVRSIARRLCVSEDQVFRIRWGLRLSNSRKGGSHGA